MFLCHHNHLTDIMFTLTSYCSVTNAAYLPHLLRCDVDTITTSASSAALIRPQCAPYAHQSPSSLLSPNLQRQPLSFPLSSPLPPPPLPLEYPSDRLHIKVVAIFFLSLFSFFASFLVSFCPYKTFPFPYWPWRRFVYLEINEKKLGFSQTRPSLLPESWTSLLFR